MIVGSNPNNNLIKQTTSCICILIVELFATNVAQVLSSSATIYLYGATYVAPFNLPGSSFDCQHEIMVNGYKSWSLVYSVQNVL